MLKHVFIINPISGEGKSEDLIDVIKDYFKHQDNYEIRISEYPHHATLIAQEYTERDNVCLYAVGGDGTANDVLNGLNENVSMAVIPSGTGNDFYRMLDFKQKPSEILVQTIEGVEIRVDVMVANGRKTLNSANMGIDADVGEMMNKYAKKYHIPRPFAYIIFALIMLFKPKKIEYEAVVDGSVSKGDGLLITMMNGQYYGGGFKPAPLASLQDGLIDVIIIEYIGNPLKLMGLLPKYYFGKHMDIKELTFLRGKNIQMKFKDEVIFGCDGETTVETVIDMNVLESAISLRIPKGCALNENRK